MAEVRKYMDDAEATLPMDMEVVRYLLEQECEGETLGSAWLYIYRHFGFEVIYKKQYNAGCNK